MLAVLLKKKSYIIVHSVDWWVCLCSLVFSVCFIGLFSEDAWRFNRANGENGDISVNWVNNWLGS